MEPVSLLGVFLGLGVLALILLALFRGEFSNLEAPKYQMLGLAAPAGAADRIAGRIGVEDRIIRLGLVGASFYYASRFGWETATGIGLGLLGAYLLLTGIWGRDPFYVLLKIDSRMSDQ